MKRYLANLADNMREDTSVILQETDKILEKYSGRTKIRLSEYNKFDNYTKKELFKMMFVSAGGDQKKLN